MKKRWILLAISIFLSTEGLCRESVYIHNGFISGNEFLSITNVSKGNYSMGLLDGMSLAPLFSGSDLAPVKLLGQCTEGMSSTQFRRSYRIASRHKAIIVLPTPLAPENWLPPESIVTRTAYGASPHAGGIIFGPMPFTIVNCPIRNITNSEDLSGATSAELKAFVFLNHLDAG